MVLTGRAVCHGRMMAKTNTVLDFTCFEMQDRTQAWWAFSRPQGLVADAGMAARDAGIMDLLADTCHSTASHRLVVAQCSCCRVAGAARVQGVLAVQRAAPPSFVAPATHSISPHPEV